MLLARRGELLWWVLANAASTAAEKFVTQAVLLDVLRTFGRTHSYETAVERWPSLTVWLITGAAVALPQWLALVRCGLIVRLWWLPATIVGYVVGRAWSSAADVDRLARLLGDVLTGPLGLDLGLGALWIRSALHGAIDGAVIGGAQALCLLLLPRSSPPRVAVRWLAWTAASAAGGAAVSIMGSWAVFYWWERAESYKAADRPWWEIAQEVGIPGWAGALTELVTQLPEGAGYPAIGALSGLVYGVITAPALGGLLPDRDERSPVLRTQTARGAA